MKRFLRTVTPKNPAPSDEYLNGYEEAERHYMALVSWCRDYIELLEKKLEHSRHGGNDGNGQSNQSDS